LFVGLLDLPLQVIVTLPQHLRFLLQGVVISHFPNHSGVTSHDAEKHQKGNTEAAQCGVDEPVRNVYSLKAPVKRMRQNDDKVILIQSVSSWRALRRARAPSDFGL
jgi:hypothetical protein